MKLSVDDVVYTIPNEVISRNVDDLMNVLSNAYDKLPPFYKTIGMGAARTLLAKMNEELDKGEDPVDKVLNLIPQKAPEAFEDFELQIRTSSENDSTPTANFNIVLPSKGKSG